MTLIRRAFTAIGYLALAAAGSWLLGHLCQGIGEDHSEDWDR